MRLRRLVPIVPFALAGHFACGPAPEGPTSAAGRLEGPNGLGENGLTSNGLFENGLFPNGLFPNGLFPNGLFPNGLFPNGAVAHALWLDEIWQQNPPALEILRTNAYARDFLKYMYECAMPAGQSTTLDPGPAGVNLELKGFIGLAPEWGQSDGACDESCQRWVTACLLARTNAYGLKVDISMRAPDDAPPHVKAALAVTDEERAAYPLREGAFYGNLFHRKPLFNGLEVMDPKFHACADKGSNIPQVTKRFCSSQGAGGPIKVVGTCEARLEFPQGACAGVSGNAGAMQQCYTDTDSSMPRTEYKEVITVYLKRPIEVCGNSICEADEDEATKTGGAGACPSDCHPGGWAQSFDAVLTGYNAVGDNHTEGTPISIRTSAIGPDNTVILAGSGRGVNLGGGAISPEGYGVVAKYTPDGQYMWGVPFFTDKVLYWAEAGSAAVALDGRVAVSSTPSFQYNVTRVSTFAPNGSPSWEREYGGWDAHLHGLAFDRDGNLIVTGRYGDKLTGAGVLLENSFPSKPVFVLKVSPSGEAIWAVAVGESAPDNTNEPLALAVDGDGNILLTQQAGLWKLSGASGSVLWSRRGRHMGVTADAAGNVYAVGALTPASGASLGQTYDFEVPATAHAGDFFIAEYAGADGAPLRARVVTPACRGAATPCAGKFDGLDVSIDQAGSVVAAVLGGNGDSVDFGTGAFHTYALEDAFVVAFSPELETRWVKHIPMVLDGSVRGMQLDGRGHVVMSGTFAGSMLIDDRHLVSNIPEQKGVGNTFLASFAPPSADDVTAPAVDHVPLTMMLEATSPAGTEVFFTHPTSLDAGNAGVSVDCSPPPNTTFALGTTTVTCTATDPLGNATSESFDVTVVDHLGPSFTQVPPPAPVETTSLAGAPVAFELPRAVDLVDGERPVTCEPASGSVFPLGTTTVTCAASDTRGNASIASFPVVVRYEGVVCGDGQVACPHPGTPDACETCDDGNTVDGDGCSSACQVENQPPDCSGASASPAFLLASTGHMWAPVTIEGVTDPDGDPVTVAATGVWQDEPVGLLWCPGGTCADATLDPLTVRAERDTWALTDPQPDGRVYHIDFKATDAQGAQCAGVVTVCVLRHYDLTSCGDGGALYNSLDP